MILCVLLICFISSCQPNSDTKQEITQVKYIVPIWKGSLSSVPDNPEIGWAYYNTTVKKSFIYDGSSWQIMSQDGSDGLGIIWKGELSNAPSNPQLNWSYYNRIDGNSYIYNGSSWDLLAKSGRDGASGILLWLGSYSSAPSNPSNGWAYYNTTDGVSYIYNNNNWTILARDGDSIVWKGALNSAPQNPSVNWAYYNQNDQTSYIWNGITWDTLATSLGGDTLVTVGISWLGTSTTAPLNPVIGDAYYNSTMGASYIYDGSSWRQISKDGKDGANGTSPSVTGYLITWKGSFSSAPTSPKAGWAYYNTAAKKSYVYDGSSWQVMAQDGANGSGGGSSSGSSTNASLIFMGETYEVIEGVTYTVKSYADVYAAEPYFYTYYKYYYLSGKIRRLKVFYHNVGSDLDYKYTEFIEHTCGNSSGLQNEYIYYENGKLQSYYQNSNSNGVIYKYEYSYDSYGNKDSQKCYQDGNLYSETFFYASGKTKIQKNYKTDVYPSYLNYMFTYYENGNEEYRVYYSSDGTETSKTYYTYYNSGNKKTYDSWRNGVIYDSYIYYDDASTAEKVHMRYNLDPSYLSSKNTYYENGKEEYRIYYSSDGTETSKKYYTYYNSGNKKTYDLWKDGVIDDSYTYYDDASTTKKSYKDYNSDGSLKTEVYYYSDGKKSLDADYNTDGSIDNFEYHFTSGYTQYYYTDSGYLYTYLDGKTTSTSTNSNIYSSKTAYTPTQAAAKLSKLKGE